MILRKAPAKAIQAGIAASCACVALAGTVAITQGTATAAPASQSSRPFRMTSASRHHHQMIADARARTFREWVDQGYRPLDEGISEVVGRNGELAGLLSANPNREIRFSVNVVGDGQTEFQHTETGSHNYHLHPERTRLDRADGQGTPEAPAFFEVSQLKDLHFWSGPQELQEIVIG